MTPGEELRYLVLALQREGNRQLTGMLKPMGLTPAQAEVLQVLDQFGQLTLSELGERLVCETGSPSRLVNHMVKRGYILKTPDPLDGRAVNLSLSENGQAFMPGLNAMEDSYNQAVGEMAKTLPISLETALELFRGLVAGTPAGNAVILRKEAPE